MADQRTNNRPPGAFPASAGDLTDCELARVGDKSLDTAYNVSEGR